MITLIEFILAGFIGWIVSVVFLDYYESERPQHRIENSDEFENYKKGIKRAKIKLSFAAGLFTAIAWLVIYHWLNIPN
jgi:uncharacterized membrane protein SpoIIM required for sporulation